jgi:hypothetical protein
MGEFGWGSATSGNIGISIILARGVDELRDGRKLTKMPRKERSPSPLSDIPRRLLAILSCSLKRDPLPAAHFHRSEVRVGGDPGRERLLARGRLIS